MKCQKCNKNEANVRYSENINGKKREICLCSECAKETGLLERASGMFGNMEREMMSAFSLPFGGLSFGAFPLGNIAGGGFLPSMRSVFADGFPEAGEFFDVDPVENMDLPDGSAGGEKKRNEKKTPAEAKAETEDTLKAKLLDAIADERYEDAAKLRDEIKKLKGE